jgi:hypothetical protein
MPRYDGPQLAAVAAKSLGRLLKGTAAEGAVPLLLAARDGHLAAAVAAAAAAAMAAAEAEQRAAAATEPLPPPDEFVCAISQQLMVDPVSADEGAAVILGSVDPRVPSSFCLGDNVIRYQPHGFKTGFRHKQFDRVV